MSVPKDIRQRVQTSATSDLVERARKTLDDYPTPYLDYIGQYDEIDSDVLAFLQTLDQAIGGPIAPKYATQWLDQAADAIEAGDQPPDPRLAHPDVDPDGHTWSACLVCGTPTRNDTPKSCGCPVGTEPISPPENDQ